MMKKTIKRKLFTWFLIMMMLFHLASCLGSSGTVDYSKINVGDAAVRLSQNAGFNDFDCQLIKFMSESDFADSDFIVSPLSLRYALALAIAGADGNTKAQLLKAAGFSSTEALETWSGIISDFVENFAGKSEKYVGSLGHNDGSAVNGEQEYSLKVANSAWHNAGSGNNSLSDNYVKYINEIFGAEAYTVPSDRMMNEINSWVSNNTNGLIPVIVDEDVAHSNTVLVNALYLKDGWQNAFEKSATKKGKFTIVDGGKKDVEYMKLTEKVLYYGDRETELVILPMMFGVNVAFVLGSTDSLSQKLGKAEYRQVSVTVPKFSTETFLGGGDLIQFLRDLGVKDAFDLDRADFSVMIPGEKTLHIDKITQKSKISVDEEGIEAAAATAVDFLTYSMGPDPNVIEFKADRPFSYFILASQDGAAELMFFGQYTGVDK
jgi:serpin B